jgi:sRNA-binding regulator protein Hfq
LLSRDGHVQLVYKHATSTVMPVAAVHLSSEAADARETDIRH